MKYLLKTKSGELFNIEAKSFNDAEKIVLEMVENETSIISIEIVE